MTDRPTSSARPGPQVPHPSEGVRDLRRERLELAGSLAGPGSDPQWTAGLHTPILDAIRERDTDGVVRAIESHFDEVRERLAGHLTEVAEQQDAGSRAGATS